MTAPSIKKKFKKIRESLDFYYHCRLSRNRRESVYFYTLHKCASTLFGGYVLKQAAGRELYPD